MRQPLQVLIVEDNVVDAELLMRELRRADFEPQWVRVETEEDYLQKLRPGLDLVLSDFEMPQFNGFRALELLKERGQDIPFIIVSGTIGEERAVEAIKQGATDYLLKDRLGRLGAAVKRALQEGEDRRKRKETEAQLIWKSTFFEANVHSAREGILVVDTEGNKILQNQRLIDLWKIPEEVARDKNHAQLEWVVGKMKNPEACREKVSYLRAHTEEVSQDELELLDGRTFERYSAPVQGADGVHYGRIWYYRDITNRKQSEERIAEQAALLDKAQDAILVRDLEGKILFWNKGAERLYGWTTQEALGRNIGELLYDRSSRFKDANDLAISRGEWQGEIEQVARDGREMIVEARWTLIRDQEGRPKSILAINTDVTEKKKIEAQFMRAQRMESIGTLAGGIAHDLNNILAPIMMAIDILKGMVDQPQSREILETIGTSARRGADIVRQVLSFARGLDGERTAVKPKQLLSDLEIIIKDTLPKDIQLRFLIPDDSWAIWGDPTQVHQILLNLCVNARDAMPEGGFLTVGVENCLLGDDYGATNIQAKPGRYVKITVTDTGTGIPPALLEKIFEPFFTTKEINKGTGLGLSTVMAIVKSHEGVINVYSEPGQGTAFKVYLPAAASSPQGRREKVEEVSLPRGNGETILLIDDESSILTITGQTLQAFGYRVLTSTDGAEAIGIYAQHRQEIAVVLTDMAMPVMDGPATIRALMRINPEVRIVATSGLAVNGALAKASGSGVWHFLAKPYTAGALLKTIQAILHEPAPVSQARIS
jgi:PAS domain S-box-containing protein